MTFQAFTRNYADESTDAGFRFTFFCDLCGDGYKTKFIEAKSHKKAGLFGKIGRVASIGAQVAGKGTAGWVAHEGAGMISERFQGMSPAWHKEHEEAFQTAQNEAKGHFSRCPRCRRYVCENDWNEEEGLCVDDAPREAVEVVAAKGRKMVADIEAKAAQTQVFTGEITTKQTICPQCGKPAGQGKFCNNCGAPLNVASCPKCGAPNPVGTRFCGECGTKLK